jgi:hypothetical protein
MWPESVVPGCWGGESRGRWRTPESACSVAHGDGREVGRDQIDENLN